MILFNIKRTIKGFTKDIRVYFLLFIFFGFFGAVLYNFYILQIEKNAYYSAQAADQLEAGLKDKLIRGRIYFQDQKENRIIAVYNKEFPIIYAVPQKIQNPSETAYQLSQALNLDEEQLKKLFSKVGDLYEVILKKADQEQIKIIESLNLKGVDIGQEPIRYAPFGNLASQVIGFVGPSAEDQELKGRYGIEALYDEELKKGDVDLVLTIDRNIQLRSQEILKNLVDNFKAKGGSIIVEEPKTGKILAMANMPDFDINEYGKFPLAFFSNSAIQALYEPGSVIKPITMAAGLDSGKLTPNTTYFDNGSIKIADRLIENWDKRAYGEITMTQVLEHSVNTGAVFAQRLIGPDIFYNYLVKFGFNGKTGIDLPSEIKGNLNNLKKSFSEVNFATASFGQGISLTPLELINAFSAIANKGFLMKPYIVERRIWADGKEVVTKPEIVRRIIAEQTAEQLTQMMISAVRAGKLAMIPSYEVAGKTGTAQVPDLVNKGYTNEVINTYVGFAPASQPYFVVLIKLDQPVGAPLSGISVVPAFKELTQFILNYLGIPPDLKE